MDKVQNYFLKVESQKLELLFQKFDPCYEMALFIVS